MRELLTTWASKLKALLRRSTIDDDLAAELEFHLAEVRDRLLAEGLTLQEADSAARKRFGNATRLRERSREAWRFLAFDLLLRDCSYAFRLFAKKPGMTALVIAVLAFGIGINTAIFSVVESVLLRPLPYPDSGRLVLITEHIRDGAQTSHELPVNSGNYLLWAKQSKAFSSIALLDSDSDNLYLRDESIRIDGMATTASLFRVLAVKPYLGAFPQPKQDRMGNGLSTVLTYRLWKRQFNGDPSLIGRTLRLNGYDSTVTGVLPQDFYFPRVTELYQDTTGATAQTVDHFTNIDMMPYMTNPGVQMFNYPAIGRLKPGVSIGSATAELDAIETQVPHPANAHLAVTSRPSKSSSSGAPPTLSNSPSPELSSCSCLSAPTSPACCYLKASAGPTKSRFVFPSAPPAAISFASSASKVCSYPPPEERLALRQLSRPSKH